jgi:ABC-type Fe3+ transport system permease subunit
MSRAGEMAQFGVRGACWAVALAGPLWLALASLLEVEPTWPPRIDGATPLAWGLVAFDPSARRILLDTVLYAGGVSLAATAVGLLLAEWRADRGRWFAGWFELATLPAVVPPVALALGSRGLARLAPLAEGPSRRAALAYVALLWAAPLVAAWVGSARRGVPPGWRERGRLYGGRLGAYRAWRRAVLPAIRPALARAAAVVFVLAAFEPGAALALDVDRLLAPRLFESSLAAPGLRSATLAVALVGIGWLAVLAAGRVGGGEASWVRHRANTATARPGPGRAVGDGLGLLVCLAIWWTPVVLVGMSLVASLGRAAGSGETLAERLGTFGEAAWALPVGALAQGTLQGLHIVLGVAAASVVLAVALGRDRGRLWDARGASLVPGLLSAAALARVHAALPLLVVAVPIARSHRHAGVGPRDVRRAETERLLGARGAEHWWRRRGGALVGASAAGGVAVVLFALGDTTILPLAAASGGEVGGAGVVLARSLALGGDPDLAAPAALALAATWMAARAVGLRVAWFGAWPPGDRRA